MVRNFLEFRGEQTRLKNCSANKFSIAIRFNLLQVCFFVPPFELAVLFILFLRLNQFFKFHQVWSQFPLKKFW